MGVQLQLRQLLLLPAHIVALTAQLRRLAVQPVPLRRQRPDRIALPRRLLLRGKEKYGCHMAAAVVR